ncbi:uncharacterized protein CXQ87_002319 [Candidozyma duobushaemuli]|uniref:Uncharacterized protein n=2 Tax=Candidozyma TaxID=3303203 RepID=A0ABX8I6X9_9ASCO|nr:uncharacterized protein CXQ87_002319 [[Candida] duobushaemulonis]PVH14192.1 hypothetical protein CXQ87_002319 [[Candida] duobushaemulonis]QWU87620.1 hypothetical protein CA3LBN_001885 [[Candida] haemuloni]
MSSATTTLDDIIDELRLKYDSSVGLLDGKAIREIPNLNTLYNLTKLLGNLGKNLKEAEDRDQALLDKVEAKLSEDSNTEDKEKEENDVEDESIPLAKRRKVESSKSKSDKEEEDAMEVDKEESGEEEEAELKDANDNFEDAEEQGEEGKASPPPEEPAERINTKDDPVPPEQRGSYTHENDTRLKNPKSEFVPSQTLSADAIAELGLFSEDNNGLDTQGKDYLKRKYGVASYPESDLKDLLPGEIPNTDFSKHKAPSNQVQFTTYQSYIESFFRPFSNDDIHFANEKYVLPPGFEKGDYDPATSPYLIPKLGPFYADVWAEEDANLRSKLSSPAPQKPPLESYKPKGTQDDVNDEKLLTEDVSVGPLSSRLLSAILSIHEAKGESARDDDEESIKSEDTRSEANMSLDEDVATQLDSDAYRVTSEVNDFYSMEERLKRELKYIGIFMNMPTKGEKAKRGGSIIDSDEWLLHKEDDEVSAEIRVLQEELKGAVVRNRQRKKVLVPVLEEQLAYQEYCTILEDLDNQVNTAYTKRLKAKSRKKKTPEGTVNVAQQQAANSGLRALMEKRRRWIESIGSLFKPPQLMKRVPTESIFKDQVHSDDEEGEAEVDVVNEEEPVA